MGHVTAGRPGARFRRGGIQRRPTLDSGVRSPALATRDVSASLARVRSQFVCG